ncbi:gid protein [Dinoroseobacter shibae DFL 12 = DSM 16493]|jgi:methylenetetrahydrofolate--tRNA-(uracil-5-)-methyltransferase|uniref:Methylenetetrahydrofolate--tRNA-(uracil-5-)-methyltransferase TrmFO n=1 Tax=Dinoroseobacter shibae (strain DSM 16493 / NCIMB 14021 / DFL 12) TaxID=398580 RepID=TRMFO_DINSH|nr:methylenetetrahydrofolate--tRNA-(uracil(54)-C(5))-methyltransferase (FADH(2)-oxidizing) TrmFO [Dinoroseobacter shibae]A8LK18.1 RecName: Full=Methylenetetrahydrofolate--tRNA-(uracil-5-)-methyltransferase TrmFO; AltName: Full=Folate-dependent tRNA (uracil-5-)-methyltransferase; AltName: Full=Folate-dependent tRNA(M-5-U54)-methyltransferase [Dinoroseobacter shibae DFL 12 = DSM 16493]ABV93217.1 gid protein [Dinoroseobacter shibae DFL 12 = DSM 16493]URF48137.1 methylenetetrahydrofolate--tRNA-(urac
MTETLHIVGGGMAGSEAAWQAAQMGVSVVIHEMRPKVGTFAHKTGHLAEMVCSNSFRSDDDEQNAVGLLHWEMRAAGGLIMEMADAHALPAGGALAVDREPFAESVTARLHEHPNIRVEGTEITSLPAEGKWIIATGPLTSGALAEAIAAETGQESLAFFDAIAPILYFDSIDMTKAWMQSRYDKGETEEERTAYLNCPMDRDQYEAFIDALLAAEKTEFKPGETAGYFDGCLPIEVMAERGRETLRHGPMKPVGLTNPHQPDVKAHAVVQLRRDNALGTLYNIVGFQTKMKYGAQKEVLRMIPGLEEARFARLGGIHRNTFINAPTLLDDQMRLHSRPNLRFAGQITGVEGYVESAAMGLLAGRMAAAEILGTPLASPPQETAMGALIHHITGGAEAKTFQPMNVNFGLFPPLDGVRGGRRGRKERYKGYTDRAKAAWQGWLGQTALAAE